MTSRVSAPSSSRSSAVFRSRDSINNFRLRVRLKRLSSTSLLPEFNPVNDGNAVELRRVRESESDDSETETRLVAWQQKIFSRAERRKYGDPGLAPKNPLEEKYKRVVAEGPTEESNRIFTHVDVDGFDDDELLTTSPTEEAGPIAVDKYQPSWRRMTILADLTPDDVESNADVRVLCRLKFRSGTLILDPGPNLTAGPYLIESVGRLDTWEYRLEDASEKPTRDGETREAEYQKKADQKRAATLATVVGAEFHVPPPRSLRVFVRGEIVNARDFEYDNLYVTWVLIPGKWWWSTAGEGNEEEGRPEVPLTGSTPCCAVDDDGVAAFAQCFTADFLYRDLRPSKEEKEDSKYPLRPNLLKPSELPFPVEEWPQLLVRVTSRDAWLRTRTEGYGATPLPSKPGVWTLDIGCWRPVGGPVDELRRFFIGGSPELDDPFYPAKPPNSETAHDDVNETIARLSRFGFRTLTTGSVKVRLHLAFQSQAFIDGDKKSLKTIRSKTGSSDMGQFHHHPGSKDKLGGMFHLVGIVQAFQQARTRMFDAREALLKELKTD